MKKYIAILLSLLLCLTFTFSAVAEKTNEYTVQNTVTFGNYEQDNNLDNGKEPIEWIVLETDGDRALLISQYCLDARAYNKDFVSMTWSKCTLRAWLNDTFLNEAFSAEEQAKIIPVTITNPNNPHYGTYGGDDTTDKIYFLSLAEVYQYFPDQAGRTAKPTAYAIAQGAFVNETNGNGWWWLRTPGVRTIDVCGVRADGRVSGYGSRDVNRPSGSLRPVLWVSIGD
jgi:eukaryotic-like serine/threonine-protein kinase